MVAWKKLQAQEKLQVTLAVSLHAPTQALREEIIPTAKNYPLELLLDDCKKYFDITSRRVSFEYTLLGNVAYGTTCRRAMVRLRLTA